MVADYVSALTGKHIKIVTILEKPFVMIKNNKYDPQNLSTKTDVEGNFLVLCSRQAVFDITTHQNIKLLERVFEVLDNVLFRRLLH